jgi:hypothetical protein
VDIDVAASKHPPESKVRNRSGMRLGDRTIERGLTCEEHIAQAPIVA